MSEHALAVLLAAGNLLVTAVLIPAVIYMARSLAREEVSLHDAKEYAHANLAGIRTLETKLDALAESVRVAMESLSKQISDLRIALAREERLAEEERSETRSERKRMK